MIKVGCLSDIHGNYGLLKGQTFPGIELLILSGDLCGNDIVYDQERELKESWKKLINPAIFPDLDEIILVPGNHDFWIEKNLFSQPRILEIFGPRTKILVDEEYDYLSPTEGRYIKIYGNPRCDLYSFAFPHLYGNEDINWIPEDNLDILVTHEAPCIPELKCIKNSKGWYGDLEPAGNKYLAEKVIKSNPKYHIFGHIHFQEVTKINEITFVNCSQLHEGTLQPNLITIEL